MSAATPAAEFANLVRNWVHYNGLSTTLSKQAYNARKIKGEFEEKILAYLHQVGMVRANIQIAGGRLGVVEEAVPQALTLTRIEGLLEDYFRDRGRAPKEAAEIIQYIRTHRGIQVQERLRQVEGLPAAVPALPALPPSQPPM